MINYTFTVDYSCSGVYKINPRPENYGQIHQTKNLSTVAVVIFRCWHLILRSYWIRVCKLNDSDTFISIYLSTYLVNKFESLRFRLKIFDCLPPSHDLLFSIYRGNHAFLPRNFFGTPSIVEVFEWSKRNFDGASRCSYFTFIFPQIPDVDNQ